MFPLKLPLTVLQATCLLALMLGTLARAAPSLQFVAPTNGAFFSTMDEIPFVLRAVASNDVFLTAEVSANQSKIVTVSYCCAACPCARPLEGQETILQFPIAWAPGLQFGQGWTNVQAGTYRLTARATGDNGTMVEAASVTITVLDLTLRIFVRPDGTVTLTIPQGSLVMGGYDLEVSQDLRTWTRLGPFEPGDVAAFYFDVPPASARERRFYRSVFVPPRGP